jgi:hypothetical protein
MIGKKHWTVVSRTMLTCFGFQNADQIHSLDVFRVLLPLLLRQLAEVRLFGQFVQPRLGLRIDLHADDPFRHGWRQAIRHGIQETIENHRAHSGACQQDTMRASAISDGFPATARPSTPHDLALDADDLSAIGEVQPRTNCGIVHARPVRIQLGNVESRLEPRDKTWMHTRWLNRFGNPREAYFCLCSLAGSVRYRRAVGYFGPQASTPRDRCARMQL